MTNKTRFHVRDTQDRAQSDLTPKHLTKQQFGKRLYDEIMQRGWNQSELARRADLPRDSVSVYIRGRSFPTPKSLQKLANALGLEPHDLLPNAMESAIDEDFPSLEMRVSTNAPDKAWLRVNRLVSFATAAQIMEIIRKADEAEST